MEVATPSGRSSLTDPAQRAGPLALCAAGAVILLAKALFASDGYLSPDSVNYLALVENVRAGHGLVTANSGKVALAYTPFAEWPAGYPLLIFAVGALTGLSSFAASKAVSVALFLASGGLIARTFPNQGRVLACVLCFAATIEMFTYTWSEVPFTFLLIALAAVTARVLREREAGAHFNALLLLACGSGLFLSRYIGALAIGHIGLLGVVKLWRRQSRYALLLFATAAGLALLVAAYLWRNVIETGHATGMERPPATATALELARQLFTALVGEVAVVVPPHTAGWSVQLGVAAVFVLLLGGLAIHACRQAGTTRPRSEAIPALSFLWVGLTYLLAIVTMRWFKEFDAFDFRLLDPAFVLIFVGVFALIMDRGGIGTRRACRALILGTAALSSLAHTATIFLNFDGRGYSAHAFEVRQRYAAIPHGSTIVFGDRLAVFLRPDLHIDAPCTEQGEDCSASWAEYLATLTAGRQVYVDIDEDALGADHHSPSVRRFVSSQAPGQLVRIR